MAVKLVTGGGEAGVETAGNVGVFQFGHAVAARADEEKAGGAVVVVAAVATGDKQVHPANAMREALFDQEVEGTINRWWRGVAAGLAHLLKQVVGLDAFGGAVEQGEYLATNRGQAGAALLAGGGGLFEGFGFVTEFDHGVVDLVYVWRCYNITSCCSILILLSVVCCLASLA